MLGLQQSFFSWLSVSASFSTATIRPSLSKPLRMTTAWGGRTPGLAQQLGQLPGFGSIGLS